MSHQVAGQSYAEGGNYRFTIENMLAICRVSRRPDVTREQGAKFAEEKIAVFRRLMLEPISRVRGVLLDLSRAPTSWGPVTHAALGTMVQIVELQHRKIAVLTADDPIQKINVFSFLSEFAPTCGRSFMDSSAALEWLGIRSK